ncbi:MAG: pilin glycosylation ligase domain-containing protein, partial [Luteimonas sp.]
MTPQATSARVHAASLPRCAIGASRAALIAFPFVFPFTGGPSPNVWQQLAAWLCAALLVLLPPSARPTRGVTTWLAAAGLLVVFGQSGNSMLHVSAAVASVAIGLAACAGAAVARLQSAGYRALAHALLTAALISALLGLLQYYGLAAPLAPWTTSPELGQAYGNLRQRNQFATLISMALIAALWLHASGGQRLRMALLPAWLLLVLAAAAATSRTGLLQVVLISGIAAFLAWRERRRPALRRQLPHPW